MELLYYDTFTVEKSDGWTLTEELPKYYDEKQKTERYYEVQEVEVTGYSSNLAQSKNRAAGDGQGDVTADITNTKIKTHSLRVTKEVDGNFGNKAKNFTFEVTVTDKDGAPFNGIKETAGTKDSIVFDYTGTAKFTLMSGEYLEIKGIPDGSKYTVRETGGESAGYKVESAVSTSEGTLEDFPYDSEIQGSEVSGDLTTNNYVYFRNTLSGEVPTGIDLKNNAIVLTALTISSWFIVMRLRRRREYEDDRAS